MCFGVELSMVILLIFHDARLLQCQSQSQRVAIKVE